MKPVATRKRGPCKGDGGRPRARLLKDKDRFAVALATFMTKDGAKTSEAILKVADMLLCESSENVGVEPIHGKGISIINKAGDDQFSEEVWRRRPLAPDGGRQWRGRLATLKSKVRKSYDLEDAIWLSQSLLGLEALASPHPDDRAKGLLILRFAGWSLSPVAESRLSDLFALRRAPENGVTRTGVQIMYWSVARREPGEVLLIEDIFRISSFTST